MPRKPKAISKNKIPEIAESLKAKAATPITVTLEDLVKSLASPIQDMLDAGYSYDDVSAVFTSHGVELAASGIKNYHKKSQRTPPSASQSPEAKPEPDIAELESEQQPDSSLSNSARATQPEKASIKSKFNLTDRRKI